MSAEKIDKLYEEARQKASNNKERQAYIRPSNYGFANTGDATRACLELLKADLRFKKAEIIGKDLLDVTLY